METYRGHIKRKLGLTNNNDLIHTAVRWVESEAAGGSAGNADIVGTGASSGAAAEC